MAKEEIGHSSLVREDLVKAQSCRFKRESERHAVVGEGEPRRTAIPYFSVKTVLDDPSVPHASGRQNRHPIGE
jgi:hypothetical protein